METSSSSKGCLFLLLFPVLLVGGYFLSSHLTKKSAEREAVEQESQQAQETAARAAEEKRLNQPIVVKGLYIGMPITELPNVVATKFGGWNYLPSISANTFDYGITKASPTHLDAIRVVCDASRKVIYIEFDPEASEIVFNATDMTAQQFADGFVESYSIPTMKWKGRFWEYYRTHDNVLVRIDSEKRVLLQKITNPSALKPTFN